MEAFRSGVAISACESGSADGSVGLSTRGSLAKFLVDVKEGRQVLIRRGTQLPMAAIGTGARKL